MLVCATVHLKCTVMLVLITWVVIPCLVNREQINISTCQNMSTFLFSQCISLKTRLISNRVSVVIFCQILKNQIFIDESRLNLHLLPYVIYAILNTTWRYLSSVLLYIFCNMQSQKILLWIVNIKSQELKGWKNIFAAWFHSNDRKFSFNCPWYITCLLE